MPITPTVLCSCFVSNVLAKYPAAMKKLEKDREELLIFYDLSLERLASNKNDKSD
ncbi:MAG: hypothetical protein ACTS73_09910 [Arsenophonus sp. NEOnobi-MAG3]